MRRKFLGGIVMTEFDNGSVVKLKKGDGPAMTVVGNALNDDSHRHAYRCRWFDKNHVYHEEIFESDDLKDTKVDWEKVVG